MIGARQKQQKYSATGDNRHDLNPVTPDTVEGAKLVVVSDRTPNTKVQVVKVLGYFCLSGGRGFSQSVTSCFFHGARSSTRPPCWPPCRRTSCCCWPGFCCFCSGPSFCPSLFLG